MTDRRNPSDVARIQELEAAFALFNQTSDQLAASYMALEHKVAHMTLELKAMQEERLEHIKALERNKRLVSMGEMAASLAHQVRTPLATALLYASHLKREDLPQEARTKAVEKIVTRLAHLDGLVNDMLRFARGEQASSRQFALNDWFESVKQVCHSLADGRDVKLLWHTEIAQKMQVKGDREALITLVQNLIQNAIEAYESAQLTSGLVIKVQLASYQAGRWFLSVADNGPGMDEETKERVFEPFFTTRAKGTGLGLAVVAGLVEAHAGQLDLLTAPGQGCCFEMHFPTGLGEKG